MNIPQEMASFDRPTLLIVSGAQVAKLYFAHNRALEEIDSVENKAEDYNVFNESAGQGQVFGTGPDHENEQQVVQRDFNKKLHEAVEKALDSHSVEEILLFCPSHLKGEIHEAFSDRAQKMLTREIDGNYVKSHPLELLERAA